MKPNRKPVQNAYRLCRNDLILAGVFAAAAIVLFLVLLLSRNTAAGDTVQITLDGTIYGSWPISSDRAIDVDTDHGHNRVVIENGTVRMEEADCPDGYCVDRGSISLCSETIVCLPHRLVVQIRNGEEQTGEDAFDVIAE